MKIIEIPTGEEKDSRYYIIKKAQLLDEVKILKYEIQSLKEEVEELKNDASLLRDSQKLKNQKALDAVKLLEAEFYNTSWQLSALKTIKEVLGGK